METAQLLLGNKRVKLVLAVIAVALCLVLAHSYLAQGHLAVTTNNSNAVIAVVKSSGTSKQTTVATAQGQLSKSLSGGEYEILVSNQTESASREVTVKARHSNVYHIDLPNQIAAQSVLPDGAASLTTDGTQLLYVNFDTGLLSQLESSGIPSVVDPLHSFSSVKWADPTFGVGQTTEGQLLVINNETVGALKVPFSYKNDVTVSYSVSSTGMVFVSSGNTIYAGQYGSNFHKYFTASSNSPLLFAGASKLAVLDSVGEDENKLTIVSHGGSAITKEVNAGGVVWAPNDQELVTTGDGNNTGAIYTAALQRVINLPGDSTQEVGLNGAVWLNNNDLIYGRTQGLWEYNQKTGQAGILASTPEQETIINAFLDQARSYVYFTAANQSNGHILLRVGLTAQTQKPPAYTSGLSVLFPSSTDQCSFSYSDFSHLDLIISNWVNQSYCMSTAQAQLEEYDLPVSGFNIIFGNNNTSPD
jgi:hypothetical protein